MFNFFKSKKQKQFEAEMEDKEIAIKKENEETEKLNKEFADLNREQMKLYFEPMLEKLRSKCAFIFTEQSLQDYQRAKNYFGEYLNNEYPFYCYCYDSYMNEFFHIFEKYFIKDEEEDVREKIKSFRSEIKKIKLIQC